MQIVEWVLFSAFAVGYIVAALLSAVKSRRDKNLRMAYVSFLLGFILLAADFYRQPRGYAIVYLIIFGSAMSSVLLSGSRRQNAAEREER